MLECDDEISCLALHPYTTYVILLVGAIGSLRAVRLSILKTFWNIRQRSVYSTHDGCEQVR